MEAFTVNVAQFDICVTDMNSDTLSEQLQGQGLKSIMTPFTAVNISPLLKIKVPKWCFLSDAIEELFWAPQRTFQSKVLT